MPANSTVWLIVTSALVQLVAAAIALRLIAITRRRFAWILITLALVLMTVRRLLALVPATPSGPELQVGGAVPEALALLISVIMLVAMLAVRRVLVSVRSEGLRASEEMRQRMEAEARYHTVLERMPDGFFVVVRDVIVCSNRAFENMLGATPGSLEGRRALDILPAHALDIDPQPNGRRESSASWDAIHSDISIAAGNGEERELEVRIVRSTWDAEPAIIGLASDVTELHRAAAAEEREERLFSQGPVILMRALPAPLRQITFASANIRQWGVEPSDLLAAHASLVDLIHPDDRDRAVQEARIYFEQGFPWWRQEYRLLLPNERVRWVADYTVAGLDRNQKLTHFDCYFLDVTDLKLAQAAAARDEALFSHGPVVRIHWTASRAVSSVSDNVRQWGLDPEKLAAVGGSFHDMIHADDRERVSAEAAAALDAGRDSWTHEYRLRTPGGRIVWVFDVTVAERDADGKVARYDGYLVDVGEQKSAELAIQSTDAILHAVSYIADRLLQNPRWEEGTGDALQRLGEATGSSRVSVFGNRREPGIGMVGTRLHEWVAKGVRERDGRPELRSIPYGRAGLERWASSLASGQLITGHVREFPPSERAVLDVRQTVSIAVVPIFVGDEWWGFIAFDQCDRERVWSAAELEALRVAAHTLGAAILRERVEDQLRQAHKIEAVGQLAGGIAHDFNNLLMAMLGAAELLRRRMPDDAALREPLDTVQRTAQRAADLTHRLLAFSRRQRLDPRLLNLNDTVAEFLPTLKRVIPENIAIDFVPLYDVGSVRADRGQLEQVIMNLAANARDAMPDGGSITIELENVFVNGAYVSTHPWAREGRYVLLTVSDTGAGMEPQVLERVFEPFFTTKPPGQGTGLGLASVYGIVKQHDGMVHAYSEPGRGTTMKVYLPLVERPASRVGAKIDGPVVGGGETVLVVEDEDEVRNVLCGVLSDLGYRVLSAGDGLAALEVLEAEAYAVALIITDLVMPRMGGHELFVSVRARDPKSTFLFSSGYSETALLPDLAHQEGVHFIAKPYGLDTLARKVRAILDGTK